MISWNQSVSGKLIRVCSIVDFLTDECKIHRNFYFKNFKRIVNFVSINIKCGDENIYL